MDLQTLISNATNSKATYYKFYQPSGDCRGYCYIWCAQHLYNNSDNDIISGFPNNAKLAEQLENDTTPGDVGTTVSPASLVNNLQVMGTIIDKNENPTGGPADIVNMISSHMISQSDQRDVFTYIVSWHYTYTKDGRDSAHAVAVYINNNSGLCSFFDPNIGAFAFLNQQALFTWLMLSYITYFFTGTRDLRYIRFVQVTRKSK